MSWDDYFSSLSLLISSRSPCHRLHVGCVLVNEKRVLSTGYNGFLPGAEHKSVVRNNHEQATVHAEQNAIVTLLKMESVLKAPLLILLIIPVLIVVKF